MIRGSGKTIFLTVQTGMVVRDLLRCGVLDRVLSHPDAHVVLLTPGVRDAAFLDEFAHETGCPDRLERPQRPRSGRGRSLSPRAGHSRWRSATGRLFLRRRIRAVV